LLGALRAAGIVTSRSVDPGGGRLAYREERFVLPDIGTALSSPSTLLRVAWAWGEADFDGAAFLGEIGTAMSRFGFTSGFQLQPASARELGGASPIRYPGQAQLPRPERPPVSRVREIRTHGLNGGPTHNRRETDRG